MADPTSSETDDHTDDATRTTGMPRWVKVSGIVVLALVALFVILTFTGMGGDHGPGRHGGGDDQEQESHDPSDWDH